MSNTIKVWDLLIRIFHWSLVSMFLLAYVTEDHFLQVHSYAGYTILGLVIFRIIWGVIGTRYARFWQFVKSPSEVIAYLKDVIHFRAKRYIGHNPAGGAMIIALLISILLTSITGILLIGMQEGSGPLAAQVADWPRWISKALEEVHEFLANFSVFLVVLHVAGVIIASFQHNENLILSMWNGRKNN